MTKTKLDVRKLKENEAAFIEGSNLYEKRLYRYNKNIDCLEYSDDSINWKVSNLDIEYLNSLNLFVKEI